jgi:hypothetical protein
MTVVAAVVAAVAAVVAAVAVVAAAADHAPPTVNAATNLTPGARSVWI